MSGEKTSIYSVELHIGILELLGQITRVFENKYLFRYLSILRNHRRGQPFGSKDATYGKTRQPTLNNRRLKGGMPPM